MSRFLTSLLKGLLFFYRGCISPFLKNRCRFLPTCSIYALDVLNLWGIRGLGLICRRLARCHPWGPWGVDPVPDPKEMKNKGPRPQESTFK